MENPHLWFHLVIYFKVWILWNLSHQHIIGPKFPPKNSKIFHIIDHEIKTKLVIYPQKQLIYLGSKISACIKFHPGQILEGAEEVKSCSQIANYDKLQRATASVSHNY